jgi:hypothetical protein
MDLTDAIKEAYAHAPAVTYYDTLQIDNEDFVNPILVVDSFVPTTRTEGTFIPVKFDYTLPETAGGVRGEMTISIIGVPKEVRAQIRNATSGRKPYMLTYRQYINDAMEPDAEYPVPLSIAGISESHVGIEIQALLPDLVGSYFPRKLMTTKALPGLKT